MAHVYSASIERVGRVEADGHVSDLHATLVSYVTQDGRVIGFGAYAAGMVDAQGRLFDAAGQPVGEVRSGPMAGCSPGWGSMWAPWRWPMRCRLA